MVQIPIAYPPIPAAAIATFDAVDLAEGTGIVQYKLFTTTDSAGDDHHMGTQTLYSSLIDTRFVVTTETPFTKVVDLDFDLSEFNLPQDIKGTATFQFSILAKSGSAGNTQLEAYYIIQLRKWDGSSETNIVSGQTATLTPAASLGEDSEIVCMRVTVPLTHFKRGETLRITVEGWGKTVGAGSPAGQMFVGHDPQNRDSTFADGIKPSTDDLIQTFDAYIPFRITDI